MYVKNPDRESKTSAAEGHMTVLLPTVATLCHFEFGILYGH